MSQNSEICAAGVKPIGYEKIALIGLFGAISVVLGIMENFIPLPVPGVRLGLANLPVMMMLYTGGAIPAMLVMILKISLVPLLSGNLIFRLSLSLPAGTAAFLGMLLCVLLLKRYNSAITTGVVGATMHMLTQLWVIDHLYIRGIFSTAIVGWFVLAALCTGILTGITASILINRLRPVLPQTLQIK